MSYEIVKNIRVAPNPENKSEYIMICTSACNNCTPHYYEEWTYGKGKGFTKEQMEKQVLVDFFKGNLQRGQSKYYKFIKRVGNWSNVSKLEEFQEYNRLDKVIGKVRKAMWGRYSDKRNTARYEQVSKLLETLVYRQQKVLENTLYALFTNKSNQELLKNTVPPFTVTVKSTGSYVRQINKRTYYTCSQPHIFTSASVYYRALQYPQSFFVEQCVAPGKLS